MYGKVTRGCSTSVSVTVCHVQHLNLFLSGFLSCLKFVFVGN